MSAVLGLSAVACGGSEPPPQAPTSAPAPSGDAASSVGAAAPAPTSPASSAALPASTPRSLKAPVYMIGNIKGRSTDQLGRMFAPTQERVAQCVPGTSGVVRITVESRGSYTLFTIDPNVALDVDQRRCILEALSTLNLDDDPTKRLGPPGFTSQVMISW